jgi:hypothetical protein
VRESRNKIFLQKKIQLCWAFILKSGVGRTLEHQINDVKKIMGRTYYKRLGLKQQACRDETFQLKDLIEHDQTPLRNKHSFS